MKRLLLLITVALGLGLTLSVLWMLGGASIPTRAQSYRVLVPPSLTRQHAPVVITGSLLSNLIGKPLEEVFVYAYQGTTPTQIPFQIDERETGGVYVAVEDGQLDENDELVFMAIDGGGWVDNPWLDAGGTLITPTYVITLTDPISNTHAWTYVFYSDRLSHTFSADYVSYDNGNDRITAPGQYTLGFSATYGFMDYLTLGDGSTNLLDRSKLWITGTLWGGPFDVNEEDITQDGVHAIDGPVRVTRVNTTTLAGGPVGSVQGSATLFAYRSLIVQTTALPVPGAPLQVAYLRTSTDWNGQASGMTYYDANNPAGATIDGIPDAVTINPLTRWTQVTGVTGTVVNVYNIPAGLGGTQSTYYKDDSTIDSKDTGDQRSYGNAGFQVDDPNPGTYTIPGHIYFPTGTTGNIGSTYVAYHDNPVQASVAVSTPASPWISVTADEDVASACPGETVTYTLSLAASEGFAAPVTLTLQGAPSGTSVFFDPNPVIPPGSSQLYITTTASTAAGTYAMTVTGTSGALTDTANLTLALAWYTYLPFVTRN